MRAGQCRVMPHNINKMPSLHSSTTRVTLPFTCVCLTVWQCRPCLHPHSWPCLHQEGCTVTVFAGLCKLLPVSVCTTHLSRTCWNCSAAPGLSSCASVWKAVGNSRKDMALGVKHGSRMPPLRTKICGIHTTRTTNSSIHHAFMNSMATGPSLYELVRRCRNHQPSPHGLLARAQCGTYGAPLLKAVHWLYACRVQRDDFCSAVAAAACAGVAPGRMLLCTT